MKMKSIEKNEIKIKLHNLNEVDIHAMIIERFRQIHILIIHSSKPIYTIS